MFNLIIAILLAADVYCSSCGKNIEGKYWKVAAQTGIIYTVIIATIIYNIVQGVIFQ